MWSIEEYSKLLSGRHNSERISNMDRIFNSGRGDEHLLFHLYYGRKHMITLKVMDE